MTYVVLVVMIAIESVVVVVSALFVIECVLGALPKSPPTTVPPADTAVAVLIPAHNEERSIGSAIASVQAQEQACTILVVADHCSDATVAMSTEIGVCVLERRSGPRGKGFAVLAGLEEALSQGAEAVVVLDADCELTQGSLAALVSSIEDGRPAQALNLLRLGDSPSTIDRISAFAFFTKNVIRAKGLGGLGAGVHLTGTGMALPVGVLKEIAFECSALAEDMDWGIAATMLGRPPRLCQSASVHSLGIRGRRDALIQRTRWEHGHVQTLVRRVPQLLWHGVRARSWASLLLAIDLAIPPLSLFCLIASAIAFTMCALAALGVIPWGLAALGLVPVAFVAVGVCAAYIPQRGMYVRGIDLVAAPLYVIWKTPIYWRMVVSGFERRWIRSARKG